MRVAIDGMSLLARLVSGSLTFTPAPTPLERVSVQASEALAGVWGDRPVRVPRTASGTALVDAQRTSQAFEAVARAARPSAGVTLAVESGPPARVRLGPLQWIDEEAAARLARPIDESDLSDWVARPGGWALLAARLLVEGQRGTLTAEGAATGATLVVHLRGA
jgi:hypothetical protein